MTTRADELLAEIVADDPVVRTSEGLEDGCWYCGAQLKLLGPIGQEEVVHPESCLWVRCRRYLHLEVPVTIEQGQHQRTHHRLLPVEVPCPS